MVNTFEQGDGSQEVGPEILEPFYPFHDLIAITGGNGLRIETTKEAYATAKQQAESALVEYPNLVVPKIRQILGDELSKSDAINLQAAETFPNSRRLFALMVRSLSPDIQGAELTSEEKAELNKALGKE